MTRAAWQSAIVLATLVRANAPMTIQKLGAQTGLDGTTLWYLVRGLVIQHAVTKVGRRREGFAFAITPPVAMALQR